MQTDKSYINHEGHEDLINHEGHDEHEE